MRKHVSEDVELPEGDPSQPSHPVIKTRDILTGEVCSSQKTHTHIKVYIHFSSLSVSLTRGGERTQVKFQEGSSYLYECEERAVVCC